MKEVLIQRPMSMLLGGLSAALVIGCGQVPQGEIADEETENASFALTPDEVLPTGPTCTPNGAHGVHARFTCQTCHMCGGVLQFDPAGQAVAAGAPLPAFDATTKTCSSIRCHGIYSGTFNYYFPGGDGEAEARSWSYSSNGGNTPSWYTTGAGCSACHNNPPPPLNWHGWHGGGNQCQLCHADAIGTTAGVGTAISTATNCGPLRNQPCANMHGNGVVDVTAVFRSTCLGCH